MWRCGAVLPTHSLCVCFLQIALGSSNHQRFPPPSVNASILPYTTQEAASLICHCDRLPFTSALKVEHKHKSSGRAFSHMPSYCPRLVKSVWAQTSGGISEDGFSLPLWLTISKNFWQDWRWQIGCRVIVAVLHASTTTRSSKTRLTSPS